MVIGSKDYPWLTPPNKSPSFEGFFLHTQTKIYIDQDLDFLMNKTSLENSQCSVEIIDHKLMKSSMFIGEQDMSFFLAPIQKVKHLRNLFYKDDIWVLGLGDEDELALQSKILADNIIEMDINTPETIQKIIEIFSNQFLDQKLGVVIEKTQQESVEIYKRADDFIQFQLKIKADQDKKELKEILTLYLDLLKLNDTILFVDSEDEVYTAINKTTKKHKIIEDLERVDISYLLERYEIEKENRIYIPLNEKDQYLKVDLIDSIELPKVSFYITFIVQVVEKFYSRENLLPTLDDKISFWEEAFSKIPLPVVLLNKKGDLIIHNPHFSKLKILPKDLLKILEDKDGTLEIDNEVYKVIINEVKVDEKNYYYCVFNQLNHSEVAYENSQNNNGNSSVSSEELGIISSSIAHELNNPIAGILAAISVIELEDDLDEDMLEGLQDMKKGALRCKELVQVFLGFSKTAPVMQAGASFTKAFCQARDILRFRMMEADLRFEFDESSGLNNKEINVSVVSMIFYLILNEVITAYSHHRLVINKDVSKVITGSFSENEIEFTLTIDSSEELLSNINNAKLIKHLISLEKLKLIIDKNQLSLSLKS